MPMQVFTLVRTPEKVSRARTTELSAIILSVFDIELSALRIISRREPWPFFIEVNCVSAPHETAFWGGVIAEMISRQVISGARIPARLWEGRVYSREFVAVSVWEAEAFTRRFGRYFDVRV